MHAQEELKHLFLSPQKSSLNLFCFRNKISERDRAMAIACYGCRKATLLCKNSAPDLKTAMRDLQNHNSPHRVARPAPPGCTDAQ